LHAGVTSFLDVDGLFNIGPALRDAIASGAAEGPTMKAGTYALMTAVGGTAGRFIPDHGTAGYAEVVRDRDEMIRVVRRQVKDGSDVIKVHVTGAIPARPGEIQVWTRDELKAVCDTAHDLGVLVSAHCRGDGATLDSILAGVDIIWHASYMGEASLEAMVDRKVAVGPVFTFLANLDEYGAKAGAISSVQDVFRHEMEQTGAMMRRAYDAGVPLLCGSESGFSITPYGEWHAREMEVFVEHLGLSPLEAITCCTSTNAIALGQQGEVGTIEPGRRADVLVLDGDPSRDVTILGDKSRFRHLICRGREVDLAPIPERTPLRTEKTASWSAVPSARYVTRCGPRISVKRCTTMERWSWLIASLICMVPSTAIVVGSRTGCSAARRSRTTRRTCSRAPSPRPSIHWLPLAAAISCRSDIGR
jgi:imidazolonepropionase-like amidohydrolase